jgi:hypothetical protein
MTKTPGTPQYPNRRPKKHEHGILTFTAATQSWLPLPTPEQARERFEAFVRGWRTNLPRTTQTTARLIVHGEVAAEVELQGERHRRRINALGGHLRTLAQPAVYPFGV